LMISEESVITILIRYIPFPFSSIENAFSHGAVGSVHI